VAKVSIVTVVKNHAEGLLATHKSILEQSYSDWEMIIVAGHSQDSTNSVARELQQRDSRIVFFEQIGNGIYEAMNQALGSVSGELTWFMNAGDRFAAPTTLSHAICHISEKDAGAVVGGYRIESATTEAQYSYRSGNIPLWRFAFNRRSGCHQAMIFRTNVLRELDGFNPSYSLAADFDLVLRVIQRFKVSRDSEFYAAIEPGGRADLGIFLVHSQKDAIRKNLLGGPLVSIASGLWTTLARTKIILRETLNKAKKLSLKLNCF
jgi:glycosyltransferase involved in cell wall biosynthesis